MSSITGTGLSGGYAYSNGNIITVINTESVGWDTPSGTEITVKSETEKRAGVTKQIGPRLYFSFLKSKFTKLEKEKLRNRLLKLQTLVKDAEDLGQQAMFEELAKMLATVVRESELVACGYGVYVLKSDIDKFRYKVREGDSKKSPVYFKELKDFPRSLPKQVSTQFKEVREKKLFDEFWVLYLDYSEEEIKTNKEKIREKDPILFGKFAYEPDKYYYITDWVDEHCDLTLKDFVEQFKGDRCTYGIGEVDKDLIERIKSEVSERHNRLKNTNSSNFRENMAQEDKQPKKGFWSKLWSKKKK